MVAVPVVNSQWLQWWRRVDPVSEGCARHSIEKAERRDGGAVSWHAAPANWPAAERHYASGEDAGEHRSCEYAGDAGSGADEHGGASIDGGSS